MSDDTIKSDIPAEGVATLAQMDEPKGSTLIVELPCGYLAENGQIYREVVVREIDGEVEDMLANKKISPEAKSTELVIRCIERIGPYSDRETIAKIVPQLLIGDSVFLILAIRRVTVGDVFYFTEKCPSCEKNGQYQLDLSSDLEVKVMPDPAKRSYAAKLPNGMNVVFHPMRIQDEKALAQFKKNVEDRATLSLIARVDSLNGEKPTIPGLKKLGFKQRSALRALFESVEGGVDTGLQLTCVNPECGEEFERELDINQKGFFSL